VALDIIAEEYTLQPVYQGEADFVLYARLTDEQKAIATAEILRILAEGDR